MKKLLLAAALLLAASSAFAVTVDETGASWGVGGKVYNANIDATTGFVNQLMIGDESVLNVGGDTNVGAWLADDKGGVTPLRDVSLSGNTITAKSDTADVIYDFTDADFKVTVVNKDKITRHYYVIPGLEVKTAKLSYNQWYAAPLSKQLYTRAAFYTSKSKFVVDGFTHIWAPWHAMQVIDVIVPAGETKSFTVIPDFPTDAEKAKVKEINAYADELYTNFNVYSPSEYKVFQRKSRFEGSVYFSGQLCGGYDSLSVRITGTSLKGKLDTGWKPVAVNKATGGFAASMDVCPGGWYKVEMTAKKGGKDPLYRTFEKVGVGEVFVIAGQSNSTNHGQYQSKQESGMVSAFNGTAWRIADDPIWGPHDYKERENNFPGHGAFLGGGSFIPAFGDKMYSIYKVPIGVAMTGHGGTSVTQWQPDTPLDASPNPFYGNCYSWMMNRINQLGKDGFRMVLWHQGENDANMDTDVYVELMNRTIKSSVRDAGWYFPWMIAKVSYWNKSHESWPKVRAAHQKLWDMGAALQGPDTDVLKAEYRDDNPPGDGIHFGPKGLKAHGEMWAEQVSKYLDKVL